MTMYTSWGLAPLYSALLPILNYAWYSYVLLKSCYIPTESTQHIPAGGKVMSVCYLLKSEFSGGIKAPSHCSGVTENQTLSICRVFGTWWYIKTQTQHLYDWLSLSNLHGKSIEFWVCVENRLKLMRPTTWIREDKCSPEIVRHFGVFKMKGANL